MIKEIIIKGEPKKFSFGLGFLGEMFEKEDTDFTSFDALEKTNPFKTTLIKMTYSYNYANELDISKKELEEMMGDEYMNVSLWFNRTYNSCMRKGVPVDETKKKVTKITK